MKPERGKETQPLHDGVPGSEPPHSPPAINTQETWETRRKREGNCFNSFCSWCQKWVKLQVPPHRGELLCTRGGVHHTTSHPRSSHISLPFSPLLCFGCFSLLLLESRLHPDLHPLTHRPCPSDPSILRAFTSSTGTRRDCCRGSAGLRGGFPWGQEEAGSGLGARWTLPARHPRPHRHPR